MIHTKFKITIALIVVALGCKFTLSAIDHNEINADYVSVSKESAKRTANSIVSITKLLEDKAIRTAINKAYPNFIPSLQNVQQEVQNIEEQIDLLMIASLNDPNDPLHRKLLKRTGPMAYSVSLNEVDMQDPEWIFFFKFLKYYTPGTDNYNNLKLEHHRDVILILHRHYESFLNTEG